MNKVSRLPMGAMVADKTGAFNPNLVRHLKDLTDCVSASTSIKALDQVNYTQNGCQITIHLSETYNGSTEITLPFTSAFDTYLTEYITVAGAVTTKTIAVVAGSKTINVDAGSVIVTGTYLTNLEDSQ